MSVQAISWVIENSKHSLGSFIVLFMVANHAKADGTGSWPSVATLAKESRMSERQVRYCLRKLEMSGELQTQIGRGPYGTNMYSLPKMRGAKFAPRGAELDAEGGSLKQNSLHEIAPKPSSLTVSKDKEGFIASVEKKIKEAERGAKQRWVQGYIQHQREKKATVQ